MLFAGVSTGFLEDWELMSDVYVQLYMYKHMQMSNCLDDLSFLK